MVNLTGSAFSTPDLTIAVGDTVQWNWVSGLHNVESGVAGVSDVAVEPGAALLGVVGDGVADDASIAARMLAVLGDLGVRVELISHGPDDVGLSCVVPGPDLDRALAELHAAFFATRSARRS